MNANSSARCEHHLHCTSRLAAHVSKATTTLQRILHGSHDIAHRTALCQAVVPPASPPSRTPQKTRQVVVPTFSTSKDCRDVLHRCMQFHVYVNVASTERASHTSRLEAEGARVVGR